MLNGLINGIMGAILRRGLRRYRPISADRTALVLVHVQAPFLVGQDGLNSQLRRLIAVARARQMPVIWAHFDANAPATVLPPAIKALHAILAQNGEENGPEGLHPMEGEIVLPASTALSAFYQTGLSDTLTSTGIERLVVTGAFADLSVDSTTRDAAEYDFHTTVIADCCGADTDKGRHVALDVTLPRMAHEVIPLDTWIKRVGAAPAGP